MASTVASTAMLVAHAPASLLCCLCSAEPCDWGRLLCAVLNHALVPPVLCTNSPGYVTAVCVQVVAGKVGVMLRASLQKQQQQQQQRHPSPPPASASATVQQQQQQQSQGPLRVTDRSYINDDSASASTPLLARQTK